MRRINPWLPVGVGLALVVASAVASALGWLGPLVACGADGARVCVSWPPLADYAVWLFFIAFFVVLLAWQIAEWRRDPTPFADDKPPD